MSAAEFFGVEEFTLRERMRFWQACRKGLGDQGDPRAWDPEMPLYWQCSPLGELGPARRADVRFWIWSMLGPDSPDRQEQRARYAGPRHPFALADTYLADAQSAREPEIKPGHWLTGKTVAMKEAIQRVRDAGGKVYIAPPAKRTPDASPAYTDLADAQSAIEQLREDVDFLRRARAEHADRLRALEERTDATIERLGTLDAQVDLGHALEAHNERISLLEARIPVRPEWPLEVEQRLAALEQKR